MKTQLEFTASLYNRRISLPAVGLMHAMIDWAGNMNAKFYPEHEVNAIEGVQPIVEELVAAGEWVEIADDFAVYGWRAANGSDGALVAVEDEDEEVIEDEDVVIHVDAPVTEEQFDISELLQEEAPEMSALAKQVAGEVDAEFEEIVFNTRYEEQFAGSMEAEEDRTAEEYHVPPAQDALKAVIESSTEHRLVAASDVQVAEKDAPAFSEDELEDGFDDFLDLYPNAKDTKNTFAAFKDAALRLLSIDDILNLAKNVDQYDDNIPSGITWLNRLEA